MTPNETLAYLAGVIDSDGCISIRKSTYQRRNGIDGTTNPVYSSRVSLKQVTRACPELLLEVFGGAKTRINQIKGQTQNSKPLWKFDVTNRIASNVCEALLPYLRVKHRQAECCLELRESKDSRYWQHSYWYAKENPQWEEEELVSAKVAAKLLGYSNENSVYQAIENGKLLVTERGRTLRNVSRIPKGLIDEILSLPSPQTRPPSLINWREDLYQEVKHLNKIGIHGTQIFHRTGYHTRLDE